MKPWVGPEPPEEEPEPELPEQPKVPHQPRSERRQAKRAEAKRAWDNTMVCRKDLIVLFNHYDATMVAPLREEVRFLMLPFWRRWWLIAGGAREDLANRWRMLVAGVRGRLAASRSRRRARKMERQDHREGITP